MVTETTNNSESTNNSVRCSEALLHRRWQKNRSHSAAVLVTCADSSSARLACLYTNNRRRSTSSQAPGPNAMQRQQAMQRALVLDRVDCLVWCHAVLSLQLPERQLFKPAARVRAVTQGRCLTVDSRHSLTHHGLVDGVGCLI
jgi:hypothetical protein